VFPSPIVSGGTYAQKVTFLPNPSPGSRPPLKLGLPPRAIENDADLLLKASERFRVPSFRDLEIYGSA